MSDNENPKFVVSYDLEAEYDFQGKRYRIRVGAHRSLTNPEYFPKIVKCIGTVMHHDHREFHTFPDREVVKVFSEMEGFPLVGARWKDDYSDVEYDGERGDLWGDEHTVYLKAHALKFRTIPSFKKIEVYFLTEYGWDTGMVEVPADVAQSESQDAFLNWVHSEKGEGFRETWTPSMVAVFVANWNAHEEEEV